MNNLLFTALLMALLYYFFYYLPSQKKTLNPDPTTKLTQSQFTQTEELEPSRIIASDPGPSDTLNGPGAVQFPSSQAVIDPEAFKNLQKQIQQKEKDEKDLTQTLDTLLKNLQDLNNEL